MENDWAKRMAKVKGYTTFNPKESFIIHCQWVVTNRVIAQEMMEALKKCSFATSRDAPPVLCYFFRISLDQSLAIEMKQKTKIIQQHPHYSKAFRMINMNMDINNILTKCERECISTIPIKDNWSMDEPIELHQDILEFDPVVIDLTELYMDNRSFVDHAQSKDYMEGYSVLLSPHRSLQPHTVVTGAPTPRMWEGLLEPILKARYGDIYNNINNVTERLQVSLENLLLADTNTADSSSQSDNHASAPYYLLEFDVSVNEIDLGTSIAVLLKQLKPVFHNIVLNAQRTNYRVVMSSLIHSLLMCKEIIKEWFSRVTIIAGRVYLFNGSSNTVGTAESETVNVTEISKSDIQDIQYIFLNTCLEVVFPKSSDSEGSATLYQGYGLHNKVNVLRADDTVICKEFA